LNILSLHNYYQQPGGEDQVFAAEASLLREKGHQVAHYTLGNDQIAHMRWLGLARTTLWNDAVYKELRTLIRQLRPQLVHVHNTFPLLSPSAYYAAKAERVPVVQTLHNYRLLCLNGLFFRDGRVCEDCRSRWVPWPGVLHACYHQSQIMSGGVAAMLTLHRILRTWTRAVDVYIALSEFAKSRFLAGGIPADKIIVKPNFLHPDPGMGMEREQFALFVGRLSTEKGIDTLLRASAQLPNIHLKIAGDGPLMRHSKRTLEVQRLEHINMLGLQPHETVMGLIKRARVLIFPSECYESFPTVIMEAFACGTPVIASRLGVASEVVQDGQTGMHFEPRDAMDLAAKMEWCSTHPKQTIEMGGQARRVFEKKYTAMENYQALIGIYEATAQHT